MTIGLILLAIVAILIFFGVAERFFRKIGVPGWVAFLLVLALSLGAIFPSIRIGSVFSMNVGGFLIPLVAITVFMIMMGFKREMLRTMFAAIAVASVAVATRMLIPSNSTGMVVTSSVIIGFLGGAVAYLIGMSRLATLAAAMSGIVIGDVITSLVYYFAIDGSPIALGSRGVFDSLIIASVFGVVLVEAIAGMKRAMNHKTISQTTLNMESAKDDMPMTDIPSEVIDSEIIDYFDDNSL